MPPPFSIRPQVLERPRPAFIFFFALGALFCLTACGCDSDRTHTAPPASAIAPTVASLSPAATDLLIGMGQGDHLVAVSNWDAERPGVTGLPRVGDYRSVDRERLSALKPDVLVVQYAPDKMPTWLTEFATVNGMTLLNIQIVELQDIFAAMRSLGDAVGAPGEAAASETNLRDQLEQVRQSVAGREPVRTFIARDETGLASVGGGNFVDDLLRIAGGRNVLTGGRNSYPTVDREKLVAIDPEVILHLLPGASAQVMAEAKAFWNSLPNLRAVKNGRVYVLDEYYILHPSHRIGDTAARFAECLHGLARSTAPARAEP